MKILILFLLGITPLLSFAAEPPPTPDAAEAPLPSDWARKRIKLRYGQVTDNPDPAIANSWNHVRSESPQYSVGMFWNFPGKWQKVRFFVGGEYKYLEAKAELSGTGQASVSSTFHQLLAIWGVEVRPYWAKPFGFNAAIDFEVLGEKKSTLTTSGFKQSLGTGKTNGTDTGPLILLPVIFEVSAFWEITPKWKLALTSDARQRGNAITLGVDYVF